MVIRFVAFLVPWAFMGVYAVAITSHLFAGGGHEVRPHLAVLRVYF